MSKVVHFEIPIDDADRAVMFYRDVFDWEINRYGPQPYWLVRAGSPAEPGVDGALTSRDDVHPYPVLVIAVDDIDGMMEQVVRHGGAQLQPKMPIPGVGWSAYVTDTEGTTIGLFQSDSSVTSD